ncbi:MAG: hypothetical protein R3B37_13930 [Nitrospira sp.]|nr:hypothetical protein [Nitrospira sp.]
MAEQHEERSKLPLTGVVALLLAVVSSLIIYQVPLKTSRPIDKEAEKTLAIGVDRVQARLWQDPFEAVSTHRLKEATTTQHSDAHTHHTFPRLLTAVTQAGAPAEFLLLPVFVDGSPYASGVESRLRDRYALVSALGAAGYQPESGESIRYFEWVRSGTEPLVVPAEAFLGKLQEAHSQKTMQVLVLWLKEQDFSPKPLLALNEMVAELQQAFARQTVSYRVLGPRSSGSLGAMLSELQTHYGTEQTESQSSLLSAAASDGKLGQLKGLQFYSSWATAADPVLLGEVQGPDSARGVEQWFETGGMTLIRTIGTDAVLAEQLVEELKRRRIDLTIPRGAAGPCEQDQTGPSSGSPRSSKVGVKGRCPIPHIALISEWDTLYGRALPRTLVAMVESLADKHRDHATSGFASHFNELRMEHYPEWVHRYSYLAGLDGELPPKNNEKDSGGAQAKGKIGDGGLRVEQGMGEAPVGRSQLDYLRRLVATLKREETTAGGEFTAIGVLGSDVYDKLMILQALRSDFPHALFFTTDLDARLTHPSQLQWTRNLVIASHFGLELHPLIQTPIPPFRDSYQTALFYSVLRAVGYIVPGPDRNDLQIPSKATFPSTVPPRLYEVGRHGPVDISPDGSRPADRRPEALSSLHLPRPDVDPSTGELRLPGLETIALLLSAVGMMVLCALLINSGLWQWARSRRIVGALVGLLLAGSLALGLLRWAMSDQTAGEPFTLTDGISVWPTTSLRLLAFILCLAFFAYSWRRLRENEKALSRRFRLLRSKAALTVPTGSLVGIHHWRPQPTGDAEAALLWREYRALGSWKARLVRIVPQTFFYAGFGVLLMVIFRFPVLPCRGSACFTINHIILGCSVAAMTLLMFYVVDATRLCRRLITIMIGTTIWWPDRLLAQEATKRRVDQSYVREWIGIEFIAKRTAVISAMIYFPFVVVFLMAVARHSYFDRWDFPIGLTVIFGLNAAYAFGNGVFLRRSAEQAKRAAVAQLKSRLNGWSGKLVLKKEQRAQVERMVELIERYQEGAFLPFTRHPLFGAIALPTGGTGLLLLLEYLVTIF